MEATRHSHHFLKSHLYVNCLVDGIHKEMRDTLCTRNAPEVCFYVSSCASRPFLLPNQPPVRLSAAGSGGFLCVCAAGECTAQSTHLHKANLEVRNTFLDFYGAYAKCL